MEHRDYKGWSDEDLRALLCFSLISRTIPPAAVLRNGFEIEAELNRRSTDLTLSLDKERGLIAKQNGVAYIIEFKKRPDAEGLD
jgi:hypothetical protein